MDPTSPTPADTLRFDPEFYLEELNPDGFSRVVALTAFNETETADRATRWLRASLESRLKAVEVS